MSTSKPNAESFVAVLKKSGLVESDRLQKAVASYTTAGGRADDSAKLAEHLIANGTVTRWQAEKLLQGKHKGYFLGKYRLLSLLGKGGMSSVYLAEHTLMRRRCALKVLPTKRVHDSSYLARFHREAQAVASLDHPNIVRAYDVDHQADRENEIHFLVMEYVEGDSLQELVQKNGVCGFLDAAEYIRQSALGLHHAHEAGMVHRDVKPGNLLVDPNGVVKVLDLGLARFFTGNETEDSLTVAHDEKVLGTADYLAPEQALDSHTVDARADIYGLGCTFYFLLAGRPPFIEGTLTQRLMAHQTKTPPAVESLRTDIPPSLAAIVRKMMAKKAEDRHATARVLADNLFAWIDENADDAWRKSHAGIYGTARKSDTGTGSNTIPFAKPIIATPVGPAPAADPARPKPRVNAPPAASSAPQPTAGAGVVENELTNFFDSISSSPPAAAPKSSAKQPVVTSLSFLKQPPHLASKSSLKLSVTAKPEVDTTTPPLIEPTSPPLDTAFPDFSSTVVAVKSPPAAATSSRGTSSTSGPVVQPTRAVSPPDTSKSKKLSASVVAGVAGGAISLLFLVAYSLGWFGSSASNSASVSLAKWPIDKREVTVGGSKAEFKTIVEALRAVRARFVPNKENENDQFVIRITAGTYRENISVDASQRRGAKKKSAESAVVEWPRGIKLIGEGKVILEPSKDGPKDGPVVRLRKIEKFVMEGIEINATGLPTAIDLSGEMNDTQLSRLTIRGFTETGVSCRGTQGSAFGASLSDEVVLDHLLLEPAAGATNAVGVRMREGDSTSTGYVIVRGCRFMGPMAAGIVISGAWPFKITMTENIFSQAQDGVRFEGQVSWKDIVLANNTFHDARHGVLFTKMPGDDSRELVVRRNLFTKIQVADGLVQEGYDEGKLNEMISSEPPGTDFNYSDRAAPSAPLAGEINRLFIQSGKRGETGFAFASTENKDATFLAPSDKSVQRKVDLSSDPKQKLPYEKPWVGAVGP